MKILPKREQYFERGAMLLGSQGKEDSESKVEETIHDSVRYLRLYYNKDAINLSDLAEWKQIAHFTDLCGLKHAD